MRSISAKNSRFFVRTCDNSSLKADRLSCLSIHILYHFFRLFALCGVALSNIALWGVALFVLHGFYGAVKETARAPRFASRGAETPRWGVSRARLGESLRAHLKSALQCTLRSKAVIVGLIFNTRQETISVSHIVMFAEKTYNAFEPVGHTKRRKERES